MPSGKVLGGRVLPTRPATCHGHTITRSLNSLRFTVEATVNGNEIPVSQFYGLELSTGQPSMNIPDGIKFG